LHGLTDSDDGPHTDAKAYVLARETLSLADASRLEIRGTVIEFSQPASFEMDVRSGRATQAKGKAARVKINGREAATDAAGGFAVPAGAFDAAYATWLQRRAATAASPDTWREPADLRQQPAEHLQQLTARRIAQCGETATCAIARNLGREASATLLMGTLAGEVLTFHPSGLLRWRRPVGSPVNALAVADFGDRRVIAAAVEDWRVQIIEAGGQLGWSKKLEIPFRLPESLRGVTTIAAARSGKSGADDLVLGTAVLDVYRLDRTGRVVWREAAYHRGVNALTVADFDGDGVEQAVVGMEASLCHVEQDGRLLRRRSLGANLKVVQTARFDGDPLPMILVGSANGFVTCVDPRANRIRWSAALGGEVTALAATQDGLGGGGALAGAEGMYVHSFDRRGAERWRRRLTDRIEAIRPVRAQGRSLLMVGAADGGLWLLDAANGRPLAFQRIDGRVLELLAFGPDGQWAAATTTGGIWMIRLPPGNGWDSRLDPRRASKHGPPASDCLRAALRLADKDKSLFDDGE
jgi:outer membrane protein assembly factor BamB